MPTSYPDGSDTLFDKSAQQIVNIQDLQVKYQNSSNFNDYLKSRQPVYGAGKSPLAIDNQKSALNMKYTRSQSLMNCSYAIKFEVEYPTKFGESIGVIGSTEELGKWKQVKVHLKWTSGHLWVSKEPFITKESYFQFKYVLLSDMKLVHWERGIDRIADLEILADDYHSG